MGKKTYAPIIVIAIVASVLLFVPMIPYAYSGGQNIPYNASVDSINLVVGSDSSDIYVRYASSPIAALIDIAWDYTIWHPLLAFPSVQVTFDNATLGTILSINFTSTILGFRLAGVNLMTTVITINPTLLTNLTIDIGSGNLDLNTLDFTNKTFGNVAFQTLSGNTMATFFSDCLITNNLTCTTGSGNIDINLETGCEIGGVFRTIAGSGNIDVTAKENCTFNKDFKLQAGSGNIDLTTTNISLNGNDVEGLIIATSGNFVGTLTQRTGLNGNLTLDINTGSGNCRLVQDYAATAIGSIIDAHTLSGTVYHGTLLGYTESPINYFTSDNGTLGSNIDFDIDIGSGNINLLGGYN